MAATVAQRRRAEEHDAATAPATGELEFPSPRFPSGVAVAPAVSLIVLVGAAACLVLVSLAPDAAGVARVRALAVGLAVVASALCGFVILRAFVVTPVRSLRTELIGMVGGNARGRRTHLSRAREVARIGTALRSGTRGTRTRGTRGVPLNVVLLCVAGMQSAVLAGAVVLLNSQDTAETASLRVLVAAVFGGLTLLALGYIHVATVRPLRVLVSQAEELAAVRPGERAPEPIAPQRLDEVGAAAAALNRLLVSAADEAQRR